jgi:hypothetical protein
MELSGQEYVDIYAQTAKERIKAAAKGEVPGAVPPGPDDDRGADDDPGAGDRLPAA